MNKEQSRIKNRMLLLDDLLDYTMRSSCKFSMCDGPEVPIRHMKTCTRCACINRAIRMGLVQKVSEGYIKRTPRGDVFIQEGTLEQFSAFDGKKI